MSTLNLSKLTIQRRFLILLLLNSVPAFPSFASHGWRLRGRVMACGTGSQRLRSLGLEGRSTAAPLSCRRWRTEEVRRWFWSGLGFYLWQIWQVSKLRVPFTCSSEFGAPDVVLILCIQCHQANNSTLRCWMHWIKTKCRAPNSGPWS